MMFNLFRKKRNKLSAKYNVFQKVGSAVEKRQRQVANYLNQRVNKLSSRQHLAGLIIFCGVFGGIAGFIAWQSFNKPVATVRVRSISMPRNINSAEKKTGGIGLTEAEIYNILRFQHYLDNLPKNKNGQAAYDSIRLYRSGLLDSFSSVHKIYQNQLK